MDTLKWSRESNYEEKSKMLKREKNEYIYIY